MNWVITASVLGFTGVALGAFGAHGLRGRVEEPLLQAYNTGVLYHLIHAVVLFALALHGQRAAVNIGVPAWLLLAGVVLFSGSLYVMTVSGLRWLGAITPIGGLCFLGAWLSIALRVGRG